MKKFILIILILFSGCNGLLYKSSFKTDLPISGNIVVPYPNLNFHNNKLDKTEIEKVQREIQNTVIKSMSKLNKNHKIQFIPIEKESSYLQDIEEKIAIDYLLETSYSYHDFNNDLDDLVFSLATDFLLSLDEGKYEIDFKLKDFRSKKEVWDFHMKGKGSQRNFKGLTYHPRRELKKQLSSK